MLGQRESEVISQAHSEVQVYFLLNISHMMTTKRDSKLFKQLLRELPYNGIKIVHAHGEFTTPFAVHLRKIYNHLRQQLKL